MRSFKKHLGACVALIFAAVIVLIDQVTKNLAVKHLQIEGNSVPAIKGFLDFTLSYNDGMAFGIGSSVFRWVFVAVLVVVGAVLIYLMFKPKYNHILFMISASLIIGGGVGNAIDRVINGYVVDFLALSFFPPICNIADYAITLGTVFLLIYVIFVYGKNEKNKVEESVEFIIDENE